MAMDREALRVGPGRASSDCQVSFTTGLAEMTSPAERPFGRDDLCDHTFLGTLLTPPRSMLV
jgi:hypothetical protein